MGLVFYDETGINPLPAGVEVWVYPANQPQNDTTLVGTSFTQPGGVVADITVQNAFNYVALFFGRQAPSPLTSNRPDNTQAFVGTSAQNTPVTVSLYRSPSLSQAGYAQEQMNFLPRGWFSPAARQAPGIAYSMGFGYAGALSQLDADAQLEISRMRIQTCNTMQDVQTWGQDFLGMLFPPYLGETIDAYRNRIIALISSPRCTIAAVQSIVSAFYTATGLELGEQQAENLAYDQEGGYDTRGGYDTSQGFSPVIPSVTVWDKMTQPALAAQYGVAEPQFVVQIGFASQYTLAWFLDHSHLDFETFLLNPGVYTLSTQAPDPRLAAMVNFVKAAGTVPLYLTGLASD